MRCWKWIVLLGVLMALMLSACQPVMPVGSAQEMALADEGEAEQVAEIEEPLRVLFIGDNYPVAMNWGEDAHCAGMAAAADPPRMLETENVTMAGATLQGLWEAGDALTKLEAGDWDVVVLHLDLPWFAHEYYTHDAGPEAYAAMEEAFLEYAARFAEAAAQAGAKTVVAVPAAYLVESHVGLEDFVRLVEGAAVANDLQVAPVGQAWQRVVEANPEVKIYDPLGIEPSIQGTYLSAAVMYATLVGLDPTEVDYSPADILPEHRSLSFLRAQYEEIPAEELAFLRRAAWETVQEYNAAE